MSASVRRAELTDVPVLVATLARAFYDDPVAGYIFPDPRGRMRRLERFFRLQLVHNYLPRGEVYVAGDGKAAALWMPPSPPEPTTRDVVAHLPLLLLLSKRFLATRRLSMLLASHHPRSSHFYLGTIGTDPSFQRRGAGSSLIEAVLSRCDALNLPAYLECSKRENIDFYASHGFVVTDQVAAPRGGPPLWLMWREAPRG